MTAGVVGLTAYLGVMVRPHRPPGVSVRDNKVHRVGSAEQDTGAREYRARGTSQKSSGYSVQMSNISAVTSKGTYSLRLKYCKR